MNRSFRLSTLVAVAVGSSTAGALTQYWVSRRGEDRSRETTRTAKVVQGTSKQDQSLPLPVRELRKPHFDVLYNRALRSPICVRERLGESFVGGREEQSATRKGKRWKADPEVRPMYRVASGDSKLWSRRGYDRGHLVPAADCRDDEEMEASFLLTNACPQAPRLNRTVWADLEKLTREVARSPGVSSVEVFTGPLFLCTEKEGGDKNEAVTPTLSIPLIPLKHGRKVVLQAAEEGRSRRVIFGVAVPSHFYKVMFVSKGDGEGVVSAAFVVPNSDKVKTSDLEDFLVDVRDVEAMVGIEFSNGSRNPRPNLCNEFACKRGSRRRRKDI